MITGTDFIKLIINKIDDARETAIEDAAMFGDIPKFLQKNLVPVTITSGSNTLTYLVWPDYFSIGTDDDFVRMPLCPKTAQGLANSFGCFLPTTKMVDQIYRTAAIKIEPRPYVRHAGQPSDQSTEAYVIINDKIKGQLAAIPTYSNTLLVAGHKKDIVITNKLKPGKVAIYGWHELNGKPIQPLYVGHGDFYVDYGHGVRFVDKTCTLNGKPTMLEGILKDRALASLLSSEGAMTVTKYPA